MPEPEDLRVARDEYLRMADYRITKNNRVVVIDSGGNGMRRFDQLRGFVS